MKKLCSVVSALAGVILGITISAPGPNTKRTKLILDSKVTQSDYIDNLILNGQISSKKIARNGDTTIDCYN